MNKFLCFSVFMLSFLSLNAQSQDFREKMQIFDHRVDSLEHQLSYLNLAYELRTLEYDIKIFANDVSAKSTDVRLNIYNRNFNSRLAEAYQQYYESCKRQKRAISKLIEVKKGFFAVKVMTSSYSETELNVLMNISNVIDAAYDSLEKSMDLLKETIDIYNNESL